VVVIGIFQRAADRFKDLVRRDPAAVIVIVAAQAVVLIRCFGIEGTLADGGPGGGIVPGMPLVIASAMTTTACQPIMQPVSTPCKGQTEGP
jgi:hypothetical protein